MSRTLCILPPSAFQQIAIDIDIDGACHGVFFMNTAMTCTVAFVHFNACGAWTYPTTTISNGHWLPLASTICRTPRFLIRVGPR